MALIAEPPVALVSKVRGGEERVSGREKAGEGKGGKRTEHRVQEKTVALSDIVGQLGVEELGLVSLLVALDEDLAYPDGAVRFIQNKNVISYHPTRGRARRPV